MAEKNIRLRIITPTMIKVDEDADMVIMRCINGDLGILPNHEPYSAILDDGILRILNNNVERRIAVFGGIFEVCNNVLTVLTTDAQWPEDIDFERAKADRERAERSLREKQFDAELHSYQVLLRRSLVRIEVSSYAVINK